MCVEKNERITDSRIKSGIQTILGGLVLGSIPVVLTGLFLAWNSLVTVTNNQQHIIKSISAIERRIESLEQWRLETNDNRFRWSDGEALRKAIASNKEELYHLKSVLERLEQRIR